MLLLPSLWMGAQSQREKVLLNQDWLFAKGHAANPEKDFNYGQALSFSKIAFLQESMPTRNHVWPFLIRNGLTTANGRRSLCLMIGEWLWDIARSNSR